MGLTIEGAFPFRLGNREASVFLQDVRLRADTWSRSLTYAEVSGDRRAEKWNREKAIARAKDEVLAALSELRRAEVKDVSIADYISNFKKKTVLLLGDYGNEGSLRLSNIADILRGLGYEPLLIKDVPDIAAYDLPQKVVAIGAVARFVVIDDSSPSGHLTEVQICRQNDWVTVLLRAGGRGGSWMTAGASNLSRVILEKDYAPSFPAVAVTEAVQWAEEKLTELGWSFDATYP